MTIDNGRESEVHSHAPGEGLALVSIGNSSRRDDGVADIVCSRMKKRYGDKVCRFDLGTHTGYLPDCLSGHAVAIIVDATSNGLGAGSLTICELQSDSIYKIDIAASHAVSWWDEIRLSGERIKMPESMTFFGIEVADSRWGEGLSAVLMSKLPEVSEKLAEVIDRKLEYANA